MIDHYETLGLQPNASKADVKNAYFRLAHRYHPDHHPQGDAAGRAATVAAFRRAKDAYDVLYDDGRRAVYDRSIRRSSSASGGGYGNRHGQYGKGASSRSCGFSTQEMEALMKEWEAKWEAQKKEWDEWEAKWEAQKKEREEREAKRQAEREKREAEREKRQAEREKREEEREKREAEREVELESTWKQIARQRGDRAIAFSADWESEWALLWERVVQRRSSRGMTDGTDWNKEIDALWERVERKRQGHSHSSDASSSGYRNRQRHGQSSLASSSSGGHMNQRHGKYGSASSHSSGQEPGGACPPSSDEWLWERTKARGFHGRGISTREEWEAEFKSLWRDDDYLISPEWESEWKALWERVEHDGGTTNWAAEWETLREGVARGRARRHHGSRNRQGQYSSWRHNGTSSSATSNGQGGMSSSSFTASNGRCHGSWPTPRVPRPMGGGTALAACCAAVLGGSALLWSMYNKCSARSKEANSRE